MQATIPFLKKAGYEVIGVDKCGKIDSKIDYWFYERDLTHLTQNAWFGGEIDMVIHAAASIYGVGGFNKYCADILSNDVTMTRNMLNFAVQNKVKKFVYISSSMVYERCPSILGGVTEEMTHSDDFRVPVTEYGLSKFVGERMVAAYKKQYGLDYVIWRPFNIITPYETARGEQGMSHVFADFFDAILVKKMEKIPIFAPGIQSRCFTWIEDVAYAIAEFSKRASGAYNIGSEEEIAMKVLLRMIWEMSGRNMMKLVYDWKEPFPNDVMHRRPNVSKLKREFNWEAPTNLETSIRLCLDEYAKKGFV